MRNKEPFYDFSYISPLAMFMVFMYLVYKIAGGR